MLDSAISSQKFNNFEIIQQLKQQICIKAPCLYQDPERARILEVLICKSDAVQSAKASPAAASVAIQFDPVKLSLEKLFILLDSILANISRKVSNTLQKMKSCLVNSTQPESFSSFLIDGMKCESCALSLEMILNRHPEINEARVDYKSALLRVRGQLSPQKIVELVLETGFEPVTQ